MADKFITLILAASVAVTGMTIAPARASDRDLVLALAALASVAVIGAALHDAKKNKRRAAPQRHVPPIYSTQRPQKAHKNHKRRNAIAGRAYRQDYNDHRRDLRNDRANRRPHRSQYGYSARPHRYGRYGG